MWQVVNCKNGVSSYEISRAINVTQKSTWFMLQRLREVIQDPTTGGKLGGEVEIDETYIGGKARNMHKKTRERRIENERGAAGKTIVMGMLERKGRVRTHVVKTSRKELQPLVREHVEAGSQLFTDSHPGYQGMQEFEHNVIDHAVSYVEGNVHTNGLENFWSLLKRGLTGTYISVEPYHLFRYVDEQAFRFNNRTAMDDSDRFDLAVRQIVGKRLTWKEVTGKLGQERLN
jgi:transposase-like protein